MTIIGLDIGDKRVGVAVADLTTRIPRPLKTIPNNRQLVRNLQSIYNGSPFTTIVVGLPLSLAGHEGDQAHKTRELAEKIRSALSVDVVFEDERMTSKEARRRLADVDYNKGDIDSVSASLILESWLSKHKKA